VVFLQVDSTRIYLSVSVEENGGKAAEVGFSCAK
jgi:hypothetical protein